MGRLSLGLLEGLELRSGGEPVTDIKTDKVRALLCLPKRQQGDLSAYKDY